MFLFWKTLCLEYDVEGQLYLCVLKVVPPQGPDLILTAHIPHGKADVLVLNCLHIKACPQTR